MLLSEGKEVANPVSAATMAIVLKMLDNLPNLQQFERVLNGEEAVVFKENKRKPAVVDEDEEPVAGAAVIPMSSENTFEARSRAIKDKINGAK